MILNPDGRLPQPINDNSSQRPEKKTIMARNAHPELTQERIIQAATELFTPRRARKRLEAADLMFSKFNPKANPKMIGMEFIALVDERDDFINLFNQGNQDGSLHVDHVEQTAEIFHLLTNMWLLPFFRRGTQTELRTRAACFFSIMRGLGIPCRTRDSPTYWPPSAPMPRATARKRLKTKAADEPARSRPNLKHGPLQGQGAADTAVHCSSDD